MNSSKDPVSGSTNVFLEHYDRGNLALQELLKSSASEILVDIESINKLDNGSLKETFSQIETILKEENKTSFDKVLGIGSILAIVSPDILKNGNSAIKNKGINIISNYIGMVKESNDKRLFNSANQMIANLEPFIK